MQIIICLILSIKSMLNIKPGTNYLPQLTKRLLDLPLLYLPLKFTRLDFTKCGLEVETCLLILKMHFGKCQVTPSICKFRSTRYPVASRWLQTVCFINFLIFVMFVSTATSVALKARA